MPRIPALLSQLLASSPDPAILLDPEGQVHWCNASAAQVLGLEAADAVGSALDALMPALAPGWWRTLGSVPREFSAGEQTIEWSASAADGSVLLVGRDVTARKRLEAELRRQEALLARAQQIANLGYWRLEATTRAVTRSGAITTIWGRTEEAPTTWEETVSTLNPDDVAPIEAAIAQALATQSCLELDYRIRRTDGAWRHLRGRGEPLHDVTGRFVGLFGVVQDVTERDEMEAALHRHERSLANLLSRFPGTAYRCHNDADWSASFISEGCQAMLGYAPEAFTSGAVTLGQLIHPDDRDGVWRQVQSALEQRGPYQLSYRVFDAAGTLKWIWEQGHGVYDADGRLLMLEGFMLDVSAGRRTHEALKLAKEEAEAASQAKSMFLANMSHELRTPLNAILGYSEMLREEAEDAGQTALLPDLDRVHAAGKHLLSLINDVLDLSKIEAGKMELFFEEDDVAALVREAVQAIEPAAQKNGDRLVVTLPPGPLRMRTDMTKLRQCLLNLLSNACKFTEAGEVSLSVSLEAETIRFRVADTGIGMSPEQVEKLFSDFTQADAGTTRKYGGTGLGLALTRRFCHLMGGTIEVDSAPQQGSVFTMRLPLGLPRAVSAGAATGGPRVLVIDDDPVARDLLGRYLAREGYDVCLAPDGQSGLALAREQRPATILLDVHMANLDGWSVLGRLKADAALASVPVIMMSFEDDKSKGFALGAADYMVKPVDRDRLASALAQHLHAPGPARVLVVDDDPDARELLRRLLARDGLEVLEAANGREALEQVRRHSPSLILLDLAMPEMTGFQFLQEARRQGLASETPIIVLTAQALSAEERRWLDGSVERVLQKGAWERERLLTEIKRLLEHALHS